MSQEIKYHVILTRRDGDEEYLCVKAENRDHAVMRAHAQYLAHFNYEVADNDERAIVGARVPLNPPKE